MAEKWGNVMGGQAVALENLSDAGRELLAVSSGARVWMFEGEMGAGKTTLIKVICALLGVKDETSSPTFSIINEYKGIKDNSVFHFDFYRIKNETEAYDMGIEEYFESGSFCFVEWPDRIKSLFPMHYFKVKILEDTAKTRKIEYVLL